MKLVIFTYERDLDIQHDILYIDYNLISEYGISHTVDKINKFNPDLILEREFNDGKAIYTPLYERLKQYKKAYWLIDAHCNLIDHVVYAKQFDYLFLAQSWFAPIFAKETKAKIFFLPLCHTQTKTDYEKSLLEVKSIPKDIELSFVGNIRSIHADRKNAVTKIKEALGDMFLAVTANYDQTLKLLMRSKATFNCSLNNDLNFRVWEALAFNVRVYTDNVDDIGLVSNYVRTYNKLDFSMKVFEDDMRTWQDSIDFIRSGHTLTHRYLQLLDMIVKDTQYEY